MCPNDKAVTDGSAVENTVNEIAAEMSTTANPVDWTADGVLPPEVRDEIYADTLPDDIVYHDGVLCSDVADVLSINRSSREEIQKELTRKDRRIVLEYSSNSAMLRGLDSLPAGSLASHKNLLITVKGAYNGHSNVYSNNNDCHRTNISPTLLREGEQVSFHVVYACLDCKYQDFYKRELEFAVPTILAKLKRLTGVAFTAGVVPVNTHVRENVPHVRAYALTPWKAIRRDEIDDDYNLDCLDEVYSDNDPESIGYRYGGFERPNGLGAQAHASESYLIL